MQQVGEQQATCACVCVCVCVRTLQQVGGQQGSCVLCAGQQAVCQVPLHLQGEQVPGGEKGLSRGLDPPQTHTGSSAAEEEVTSQCQC